MKKNLFLFAFVILGITTISAQTYWGTSTINTYTSGDASIGSTGYPASTRLYIYSNTSTRTIGQWINFTSACSSTSQKTGIKMNIGAAGTGANVGLDILTSGSSTLNIGIQAKASGLSDYSGQFLGRMMIKAQSSSQHKLLTIQNSVGTDVFLVWGDGVVNTKKIYAEGIEVKTGAIGTWPDYVFQNNYKLMSLQDLEKFVTTNKHLPEVPAASEVENKSIDLVKMNTVLLKKVEELTLYVIELQKQIDVINAKK